MSVIKFFLDPSLKKKPKTLDFTVSSLRNEKMIFRFWSQANTSSCLGKVSTFSVRRGFARFPSAGGAIAVETVLQARPFKPCHLWSALASVETSTRSWRSVSVSSRRHSSCNNSNLSSSSSSNNRSSSSRSNCNNNNNSSNSSSSS